MMGNLFSDESQLIGVTPRNRAITYHILCNRLILAYVPPTTKSFPYDGIVGFLCNF